MHPIWWWNAKVEISKAVECHLVGKTVGGDHYDIRKNLKKTYFLGGEEVYALDDVSLSIKEHEFVAIIGQSGSGKSTFMNMLGCLDRPGFWRNNTGWNRYFKM